jgi:transmembrane protein TMEM174 (potassium channel)
MSSTQASFSKARFEAFSDGVMAVIITIMVLDLKVPRSGDPVALVRLWPSFAIYLVSFFLTTIYWINHHSHMMQARRVTTDCSGPTAGSCSVRRSSLSRPRTSRRHDSPLAHCGLRGAAVRLRDRLHGHRRGGRVGNYRKAAFRGAPGDHLSLHGPRQSGTAPQCATGAQATTALGVSPWWARRSVPAAER